MIVVTPRRAVLSVVLTLLVSAVAFGQAPAPGTHTVTLGGRKQHVHCFTASGAPMNRRILFAPGDGGWRGWAIPVAETMATWGYDVCGLDTRAYLDGFTGKTTLTEADAMDDLRTVAAWMTQGSGERVTLVGWSAGAGLGVLAAAGDTSKQTFAGLVVFGLGDENLFVGWHWWNSITSLVKKPRQRTFLAADYLANVTPLPFFMIQSGHDEYTPLDDATRLFAVAGEPKRFVLVPARNHQFGGNQEEFFRTLREALRWIEEVPTHTQR
jgi:fermentation-respiration switch protein FrsA (DUF1100 family)